MILSLIKRVLKLSSPFVLVRPQGLFLWERELCTPLSLPQAVSFLQEGGVLIGDGMEDHLVQEDLEGVPFFDQKAATLWRLQGIFPQKGYTFYQVHPSLRRGTFSAFHWPEYAGGDLVAEAPRVASVALAAEPFLKKVADQLTSQTILWLSPLADNQVRLLFFYQGQVVYTCALTGSFIQNQCREHLHDVLHVVLTDYNCDPRDLRLWVTGYSPEELIPLQENFPLYSWDLKRLRQVMGPGKPWQTHDGFLYELMQTSPLQLHRPLGVSSALWRPLIFFWQRALMGLGLLACLYQGGSLLKEGREVWHLTHAVHQLEKTQRQLVQVWGLTQAPSLTQLMSCSTALTDYQTFLNRLQRLADLKKDGILIQEAFYTPPSLKIIPYAFDKTMLREISQKIQQLNFDQRPRVQEIQEVPGALSLTW